MWGDSMDDLSGPNTDRSGDADVATEAYYGPVKFAALAYDQAVRITQPDSQGPSWARQYQFYLRPNPFDPDSGPTAMEVEDRRHRRPAAVPLSAFDPADSIGARAEVFAARERASLGML